MAYQTEVLRAGLESKKAELVKAIRSHSSQLSIGDEHELLDRMQVMYNRDQTVTLLEVMTRTLAEVRAALHAVDEGSYGICVECEEDIAPKRLATIPWTSHCIRCKQLLEQSGSTEKAAPAWHEAV